MGKVREIGGPPPLPLRLAVAISADAGDFGALETLLAAVPPACGIAFFIVASGDEAGAAEAAAVIARHTAMPTTLVAGSAALLADHVYVLPGAALFTQSSVSALPRSSEVQALLPCDQVFRALAAAFGRRAAGVILSDSSSGVLGVAAIREALGLTLAQEPKQARPAVRASGASTAVDLVLPPERLVEALLCYASSLGAVSEQPELSAAALGKILLLIRARVGHDFSGYRSESLSQRIKRRMRLHRLTRSAAYLELLRSLPNEAEELFRDLLMSASAFFRDPPAFAALKSAALRELLLRLPPGESLRVWVPGCATGEEAYSIAILLCELMAEQGTSHKVEIFGTDLDPQAIQSARLGAYPLGIAGDVGEERLKRFFVYEGDRYRVTRQLRQMTIFATQNLSVDPPFSRLDLISCRNVFMHFESRLIEQVLPLFHYALRPGGVLFTGVADSLGALSDRFEKLDAQWNIYRRKELPTRVLARFDEARASAGLSRPLGAAGRGRRAQNLREPLVRDEALEQELHLAVKGLRKTVADHAAANEALQAEKEGLQSACEELTSANEELVSVSEDERARSEELETRNAELREANADLLGAHDDLRNLTDNLGVAALFLDKKLRIKRFVGDLTPVMNLIPADLGRYVGELQLKLDCPQLEKEAGTALETLSKREIEARSKDGVWYRLRLTPCRTARGDCEGLIMTFVEITRASSVTNYGLEVGLQKCEWENPD